VTGPHLTGIASDFAYLCLNCGAINRFTDWSFMKRDYETGALVPVSENDYDPICICPGCGWEHVDDDSNPGIYDGSLAELAAERERLAPEYAELWEQP
jgi:hypothetical protein